MKKDRVMIIPTFKNNQEYFNLYKLNNFTYKEDLELPWSDELEEELDKFESVYSLTDITNYTSYLKLASKMNKINTSLCGDFSRIEKIMNKYPNIKFGIYFPGKSMYKVSGIGWEEYYRRIKTLQFKSKLESFAYLFYMRNWENALLDIAAAEEFFDDVYEKVFYIYQPNDLQYLQSLNKSELKKLKDVFNKIFLNYEINEGRYILDFVDHVPFYEESYYIMPDSPKPRLWMQKKDANKDCLNCTAINFTSNECSNCYLHQKTNNFSLEAKEIYRSNLLEIKNLLK